MNFTSITKIIVLHCKMIVQLGTIIFIFKKNLKCRRIFNRNYAFPTNFSKNLKFEIPTDSVIMSEADEIFIGKASDGLYKSVEKASQRVIFRRPPLAGDSVGKFIFRRKNMLFHQKFCWNNDVFSNGPPPFMYDLRSGTCYWFKIKSQGCYLENLGKNIGSNIYGRYQCFKCNL